MPRSNSNTQSDPLALSIQAAAATQLVAAIQPVDVRSPIKLYYFGTVRSCRFYSHLFCDRQAMVAVHVMEIAGAS